MSRDDDYMRSLVDDSSQRPTLYGNLPHDVDTRNMNFTPRENNRGNQTRGGAFAAQPSFINGILNLRPFRWGSYTYMIAPPVAIEGDKSKKSIVLSSAIKTMRTGEGTWATKTTALVSHFQQQALMNQAELETAGFQNFETAGLFNYEFDRFLNSDMSPRAVPGGVIPAAALPNANQPLFRVNVRYIQFTMTVNPRVLNNGTHIPAAVTRPSMVLKLPIEPYPNAPGTYVLEHRIHDGNARLVPSLLARLRENGAAIQMGILKDGFNDQEAFDTWLKKIVDQTKFEIVATLMRPAYVGDGVLDTAINRLQTCKQWGVDENGRANHMKVEPHYSKFMSIVSELDPTTPYNIELPYTFLNSLADPLKNKIIRGGYHPPQGGTNMQQHTQLITLKDQAIAMEGDLKETLNMVRIAQTASGRSNRTRTPQAQAFMMPPAEPPSQGALEAEWASGGGAMVPYQASGGAMVPYDAHIDSPATAAFAFLAQVEAHVCVSTAETAMRQASGERAPLECWGCTNDARFHEQRFHRFNQCPNMHDPAVKKRAWDRIQNLRNAWKDQRNNRASGQVDRSRGRQDSRTFYTPAEINTHWSRLGFRSKRNAQQAMALMARGTNAKRRKNIIMSKTNDFGTGQGSATPTIDNTNSEETTNALWAAANAARNDETTDESPDLDLMMGQLFICYIKDSLVDESKSTKQGDKTTDVSVFLAPSARRVPLQISRELPHAQIPIGKEGGPAHKLLVAVDSCAGVNLGELEYHAAMHELYPELVHTFKPVSAFNEPDIVIGGANHNDSLVVTHIIIYHTPMSNNGLPSYMSFGLSKDAAATAIVSISFLRNAKALWNFDDVTPSIYFQKWNTSVPVTYVAPRRRLPPTQRQYQQDEDDGNIFFQTAAGMEKW